MATFDISRVSFNPLNHFKSVRMQQGRVLTDDDWNENERIENDDRHRSLIDIIGGYGTPDDGFRIDLPTTVAGLLDFNINPGTVYLGGLRLEMDVTETFRTQSDWLENHDFAIPAGLKPGEEKYVLAYLESWQQPVCAIEDEELFEVALGGPDTTTRLKNMRRVKLFADSTAADCPGLWKKLKDNWVAQHFGVVGDGYERVPNVKMKVSFSGVVPTDNLCTPSLTGGYLGAENQAIRVQITRDAATAVLGFTWGYDNASPYYKVRVNGTTVTMDSLPKDQYHWPLSGQIVEILPLSAILPNGQKIAECSGEIIRIDASYDPDLHTFTLLNGLSAAFPTNRDYYFARIWNRGTDFASPMQIPIPPPAGVAALGNTGLQIGFIGNDLVPDDYWVIAARPDAPKEIVPWELTNAGIAPQGIRRYFAPLAVIRFTGSANGVVVDIVQDCRRPFRPLTEQECCCTYTVGDGLYSKGDFNSIEKAVAALPLMGGKICVLPGFHFANVQIIKKRNVQIYGCGEQAVVRPRTDDKGLSKPIFYISNSQSISICHLTLVTIDGTAIELRDEDQQASPSYGMVIGHNRIMAAIHGINIIAMNTRDGNNGVNIHHNLVAMLNVAGGKAGIFSYADSVLIERNRVVIVPGGDGGGGKPPGGGDWPDPCISRKRYYGRVVDFLKSINSVFGYALTYRPVIVTFKYKAQGGIQIACGSEKVWVLENIVIGGWGNGITLGNLPADLKAPADEEPPVEVLMARAIIIVKPAPTILYEIKIDGNQIYQMGSSGIGVVAFLLKGQKNFIISVIDLTIFRNYITQCAVPDTEGVDELLAMEAVLGGITLGQVYKGFIQNNRIEQNGTGNKKPTGGIFILIGAQLDISENHLVENGYSGGINLKAVLAIGELSLPAARLHTNMVSQPIGKALQILALGPLSIVANQFVSQGLDELGDTQNSGSAVSILNLGVSRDLNTALAGGSMRNMGNVTNGQALAGKGHVLQNKPQLPSGKILFTDNQVTLDLQGKTGESTNSSVLIATLGDIGFNDNQLECKTVLPQKELVATDALLVGSTIRSNDNRFEESTSKTVYSLLSYGTMNIATGNESTHCLIVLGSKRINTNNLVWFSAACNARELSMAASMGALMKES